MPSVFGVTPYAFTPAPGETKIDPNNVANKFAKNGWGSPGTQFWVNMLAHEVIWLGASGQYDAPSSDDINSGDISASKPFTVSSDSRSTILKNFDLRSN
jgi:hypothetical protein